MYCQYCGKELSDSSDNYCRNCGKKLKTDSSAQSTTPSLKWFNFFYKIYLPVVIFFGLFSLAFQAYDIIYNGFFDLFSVSCLVLDIVLYIVIPLIAYIKVEKSKEIGYRVILIFLICDYVCKTFLISTISAFNNDSSILENIILTALIYAIWFIPNIIYFLKRKKYFLNNM